MPSVFEVLSRDHEEVKQMLSEFERGPTAANGASPDQLAAGGVVRRVVDERTVGDLVMAVIAAGEEAEKREGQAAHGAHYRHAAPVAAKRRLRDRSHR